MSHGNEGRPGGIGVGGGEVGRGRGGSVWVVETDTWGAGVT